MFNMNPKFREVTLDSFIFVMNIFAQILQGNLGQLVLHMSLVSVTLMAYGIKKLIWTLPVNTSSGFQGKVIPSSQSYIAI